MGKYPGDVELWSRLLWDARADETLLSQFPKEHGRQIRRLQDRLDKALKERRTASGRLEGP